MGTYTANQRFYQINPTELVDVNQDLNYNLRRADQRVKPLVEYQWTDVESVSQSDVPKDTGFRWYKTYTNSIWNWQDNDIYQDGNGQIAVWQVSGITFESGYGSRDDTIFRIAYAIHDNHCTWRGELAKLDGSDLPANVSTDVFTPPDSTLPLTSKYITVYGGNATGDFQCGRIFIPAAGSADKRIEFCKYGGNGNSSTEKYLSFNDVAYPLDV